MLQNLKQKKYMYGAGVGAFCFLLLGLLYPFLMGSYLRSEWFRLEKSIAPLTFNYVQIENTRFDKGLFSSQSQAKLTMRSPSSGDFKFPEVTLSSHINHFTGNIEILAHFAQQSSPSFLKDIPDLHIRLNPSLWGSLSIKLDVDKMESSPQQEGYFMLQQLQAQAKLNKNYSLEFVQLDLGDLKIIKDSQEQKISGAGLILQIQRYGVRVNSSIEMFFDKLLSTSESFGPGLLKFSANNWNAQTFAEMGKMIKKYYSGSSSSSSSQGQMELSMMAMQLLPEILKYSPLLELTQLQFHTPQGEVHARAQLGMRGGGSLGGGLGNILSLFSQLIVEVDLRSPVPIVNKLLRRFLAAQKFKPEEQAAVLNPDSPNANVAAKELLKQMQNIDDPAIVAQADSKIKEWEQKKWLLLTPRGAVFQFQFKNGKINLNGNPMSINQLTQ